MMGQSKKKFKALPQEEQNAILKAREEDAEHKRREQCIQQCICPNCGKRLIRGKKDKHNDYMRTWSCQNCNKDMTK